MTLPNNPDLQHADHSSCNSCCLESTVCKGRVFVKETIQAPVSSRTLCLPVLSEAAMHSWHCAVSKYLCQRVTVHVAAQVDFVLCSRSPEGKREVKGLHSTFAKAEAETVLPEKADHLILPPQRVDAAFPAQPSDRYLAGTYHCDCPGMVTVCHQCNQTASLLAKPKGASSLLTWEMLPVWCDVYTKL